MKSSPKDKERKLAKYLKGTAKALIQLAKEIEDMGEFNKESEDLLSKIGANLLFEAKAYGYRSPIHQ